MPPYYGTIYNSQAMEFAWPPKDEWLEEMRPQYNVLGFSVSSGSSMVPETHSGLARDQKGIYWLFLRVSLCPGSTTR